MASLAAQLAALADPTPREVDPEGEFDENVLEKYEEENDDRAYEGRSALRARASAPELGAAYRGKKVSRKDLEESADETREFVGDDEDEDVDDEEEDELPGSSDERADSEIENEVDNGSSGDSDDQDSGDDSEEENMNDDGPELQMELRRIEQEEKEAMKLMGIASKKEQEKAKSTKSQRIMWDSLMDFRIALNPTLSMANSMPPPTAHAAFCQDGDNVKAAFQATSSEIKGLIDDLITLSKDLRRQNKTVPQIDEKVLKRKRESANNYWEVVNEVTTSLDVFQNETIDKWNSRTQLGSGAILNKKFKAINQSVLSQIDQILSDQPRLLKRAHTNRLRCVPFGIANMNGERPEPKEEDEEIFDDTDFYQSLLREVIENSSKVNDAIVGQSQQWMQVQKQNRSSKEVDRRASKGRKIRYTVDSKLVNFMFPLKVPEPPITDELFQNIFGARSSGYSVGV